MSDTKLDTRSLSAEEEAILDACFRGNIHDLGSAIVCYGRALFGQGESEAKATRDLNRLPEPAATDVFATDRAIGVQAMNAEDVPAATEMPEAVRKVCHRLRHLAMTSAIACRIGDRDEFDEYADALESWWRTHASRYDEAVRLLDEAQWELDGEHSPETVKRIEAFLASESREEEGGR